MRCTVPGSTPNCLAMTRTPGRPESREPHGFVFRVSEQWGGARGVYPHSWPAQARHGLVPESSHARIRQIRPSSEGKILSSRTQPSGNRAAALLRLAATTVGRTETTLGAFYRRLSARIGKAKAVTATARKIAVLFYNAVRNGMDYADPGASYYEERYRRRVLTNLQRRAKAFGYVLQPTEIKGVSMAVS
jgi:hypothetical protein